MLALVGCSADNMDSNVQLNQGALTQEADLGPLDLGDGVTVPLRGYLAAPESATDAPLIILDHLRAYNCADDNFANPCPDGVEEARPDRGMHYLADHLAQHGYAALVPDYSFLYAEESILETDQETKWLEITTKLRDEALAASVDKQSAFGADFAGKIGERVGLFGHSRSAIFMSAAAEAFGAESVAVYGGFYMIPEDESESFSAAPADVRKPRPRPSAPATCCIVSYFFTEDFASSPRSSNASRTSPVAVSSAVATSVLVSEVMWQPWVASHSLSWIGEFGFSSPISSCARASVAARCCWSQATALSTNWVSSKIPVSLICWSKA